MDASGATLIMGAKKLIIEKDKEETVVDSRPSDAIALAISTGAPIFVDESVLTAVGAT